MLVCCCQFTGVILSDWCPYSSWGLGISVIGFLYIFDVFSGTVNVIQIKRQPVTCLCNTIKNTGVAASTAT